MASTFATPVNADRACESPEALASKVNHLLRCEIQFISNPEFHHPALVGTILGCENTATPASVATVPRDLPAHLARLCETPLLSAERERDLFRKMNYLKFRANAIRATLDPTRPNAPAIARLESYLAEAREIRDYIVNANIRLVMSIVKNFVTPQLSFDEMLSDGIWALVQSVEKFDYDRGFRFSTYAYRSIARHSYRQITDMQKELSQFSTTRSDDSNVDFEAETQYSSMDERTWSALRTLLGSMLHQLDRRERFVIRSRYALGAHRKVRTFQYLADKLGVSKERVRQLEQRAVGKLKAMAAATDIDDVCGAASC